MPGTTPLPTLTVRRAGPDDAELVQAMVMQIAAHEGDTDHVRVNVDHWREQLTDPDVIVFIAHRGGHPAGYVSAVRRRNLWGGDWLIGIDDLYVREENRSQRVGEQLMASMAAHAAPEQMILRWELNVDNTGAQRFYARLGASLRTKMIAAWVPRSTPVMRPPTTLLAPDLLPPPHDAPGQPHLVGESSQPAQRRPRLGTPWPTRRFGRSDDPALRATVGVAGTTTATEEMSSMSSFMVEEEQGTFTGTIRHHNGYFAGDFSEVPMATPRQLAALTALQPITFGPSPR